MKRPAAKPPEKTKKLRLHDGLSKKAVHEISAETLRSREAAKPPPAELQAGDRMPDGTLYAGISPDTNQPMYAAPKDAPETMRAYTAEEYAAGLDAQGHRDWRVPSKGELGVLFNNRAAIGGFDLSASYWSSTRSINDDQWEQRFSDGKQFGDYIWEMASVRCIRRGP